MKKHKNEPKAGLKRQRPPPPSVSRVKGILSGLDMPSSDELICEIHGHLNRHHVMLETTDRMVPSKLRKELEELIIQTRRPDGDLLTLAGCNVSDAALRQLSMSLVDGEPLETTAERCLRKLEIHPRGPQNEQKFNAILISQLKRTFADNDLAITSSFNPETARPENANVLLIYILVKLVVPKLTFQGFRNRWYWRP